MNSGSQKKANVSEQILQRKGRSRHNDSSVELISRVSNLERLLDSNENIRDETARYFPVATIACLESFFRSAVKEMINRGEPYISNAQSYIKTIKLDVDIVNALHGRQITIGDIVAYQLPFSRIDHLYEVFDNTLSVKFKKLLEVVYKRWDHEVEGIPRTPILTNPNQIFLDVAKTFEIRHIICHEWATKVPFTNKEILAYSRSTITFLEACYEVFSNTIDPDHPLTQTAMNIRSGNELKNSMNEIRNLKTKIAERLGRERLIEFEKADKAWENYMKTWAEFHADEYKGGSIRPLIYASEANSVAQVRIEQLKEMLETLIRYNE